MSNPFVSRESTNSLLDFDPRKQIPPWVPTPDPLGVMSVDENGNVIRKDITKIDIQSVEKVTPGIKNTCVSCDRKMARSADENRKGEEEAELSGRVNKTENGAIKYESQSKNGLAGESRFPSSRVSREERDVSGGYGYEFNHEMYFREKYFERQRYVTQKDFWRISSPEERYHRYVMMKSFHGRRY